MKWGSQLKVPFEPGELVQVFFVSGICRWPLRACDWRSHASWGGLHSHSLGKS